MGRATTTNRRRQPIVSARRDCLALPSPSRPDVLHHTKDKFPHRWKFVFLSCPPEPSILEEYEYCQIQRGTNAGQLLYSQPPPASASAGDDASPTPNRRGWKLERFLIKVWMLLALRSTWFFLSSPSMPPTDALSPLSLCFNASPWPKRGPS